MFRRYLCLLLAVAIVVAPLPALAGGVGQIQGQITQAHGAPVQVQGVPTNGYVLKYSSATNTWGAAADASTNYPVAPSGGTYTTAAAGTNATAIGDTASAAGNTSFVGGYGASATQTNGIAVGNGASSTGVASTVIGAGAGATNTSTFAAGNGALASGSQAVAIGTGATASSTDSVALGEFAQATTGTGNIAIGSDASATGVSSTAVGKGATASTVASTAVGQGAQATGGVSGGTAAFGQGAQAAGAFSTALGSSSIINHTDSIGLGVQTTSTAAAQLVVGSTGHSITTGYIGNGVTNAAPASFTLSATGGTGAAVAGAAINVSGGISGDAATGGGAVNMQVALAGTGTTRTTVGSFASSGVGGFTAYRTITAVTQAASPRALAITESRTVFTNEGATAGVNFTLPTAVAGYEYEFVVQDADGVTITAAGGDTVQIIGSVSAAGGTLTSTTIGSTVKIVSINATQWIAISCVGTWVVT